MKLSRYNIILHEEPNPGEALIFNTLSGALFLLEPEYYMSLLSLIDGSNLTIEDHRRLSDMMSDGFVINDSEEESNLLIHKFRTISYSLGTTLKVKIMTTMACNLSCKYCFESDMDRTQIMNKERSSLVIKRLIQRAKDIQAESISVDFYGGEPLLNMEAIIYIAENLREWAIDNGKQFIFSLTTNGTLLNFEIVNQLKPLGLARAQVCIDGVREIHDKRRPFRCNTKSSYQEIIENLCETVDILPITITSVCSDETIDKYSQFLDELTRTGIINNIEGLRPGLEMNYIDSQGRICENGGCFLGQTIASKYLNIVNNILSRNLPFSGDILAPNGCSLFSENGNWVVTPKGDIYKCPLICHRSEYAIGSLLNDDLWINNYRYINRELWWECLQETDCPYLPMCGIGVGCRVNALQSTGDFWEKDCKKIFFDSYIPNAIKIEYNRFKVDPK